MALGDVFGLDRICENQLLNYTNYSSETVSSYGYFGGGYVSASSYYSNFERVDYSNETIASIAAFLSLSRAHHSVTQKDGDYGYLVGGYGPPGTTACSNVDKIDLTNESISRLPTNFPQTSYGAYGVYTTDYGYYAGYDDGDGESSYIDRITFSSDTFSTIPSRLTDSKRLTSGFHSRQYGYWTGGTNAGGGGGGGTTRIVFSSETTASIPGLPSETARTSALTGSSAILYSGNSGTTSIDRFTFSSETTTTLTATRTPTTATSYVGSSESPQYGYFLGGGTSVSSIDRFDFKTNTNTASFTRLPVSRGRLSGGGGINGGSKITRGTPKFTNWNESATHGYYGGGYNHSSYTKIDLITEVTSSSSVNSVHGNTPSMRKVGSVSLNQYGFSAGGQNNAGDDMSVVSRFDFVSETDSVTDQYIANTRVLSSHVTNKRQNYGYWGGGYATPSFLGVSSINRIDASTGSVSKITNLGLGALGRSGVSNSQDQYGYFIGGFNFSPFVPTPGSYGDIDKFDLDTNSVFTISAGIKGYFGSKSGTKSNLASYIMSNYGSGNSYIHKLEFSNDTFKLPGGSQSLSQNYLTETVSSMNYGFTLSGYNSSPPAGAQTANVRIDFETETTSLPGQTTPGPAGNRREGIIYQGSTSLRQVNKNNRNDSRAGLDNRGRQTNASYGYDAGGIAGSNISSINRFDMLNETNSNLTSKLTTVRRIMDSVSNNNFGYFGGGLGPVTYSLIDRIDFTNESINKISAVLSQSKVGSTSVHSYNYGYFMGGDLFPGVNCTVDRIDFSTESRNQMSNSIRDGQVTFNKQYSYINNSGTNINRFDLINETYSSPTGITLSPTSISASVNSPQFGYYISTSPSPVSNKLDFSTETTSTFAQKATVNRFNPHVYYNTNYGYFGGGYAPGGTYYSSVDRIEYSNESITNTGRPAADSKQQAAGVENAP